MTERTAGGAGRGPTYAAAPGGQSYAPARAFSRPQEAVSFARRAAKAFRVGYAVWGRSGGRVHFLRAFPAPARA